VLGDPADDLDGGPVLGFVQRGRDVGCSAAASDQVFGPLTVTSTNRNAFASSRTRPFDEPVSTSTPATHCS
jgi:hypothetical protein